MPTQYYPIADAIVINIDWGSATSGHISGICSLVPPRPISEPYSQFPFSVTYPTTSVNPCSGASSFCFGTYKITLHASGCIATVFPNRIGVDSNSGGTATITAQLIPSVTFTTTWGTETSGTILGTFGPNNRQFSIASPTTSFVLSPVAPGTHTIKLKPPTGCTATASPTAVTITPGTTQTVEITVAKAVIPSVTFATTWGTGTSGTIGGTFGPNNRSFSITNPTTSFVLSPVTTGDHTIKLHPPSGYTATVSPTAVTITPTNMNPTVTIEINKVQPPVP